MVKTHTRTKEERKICTYMLRNLIKFPLFENSHTLVVHQNTDGFSISYRNSPCILITPGGKMRINPSHISLDIQVQNRTGYTLGIHIPENERRKGYGRQLYNIAECLFKNLDCSIARTTPSGQGIYFWPKMGFKPFESQSQKIL